MKNRLEKKNWVSIQIISILLVAYNILFFAIPFNRELSCVAFWLTYGVTHFIAIANVFLVFLGINDRKVESRIFGIPIIQLGVAIGAIQLGLDILVMLIGNWVAFPYWLVIILEVVLLTVFGISTIVRKTYKNTIIRISSGKNNEEFIKNLRIELEQIFRALQGDAVTKRDMFRLLESARYTIALSDERVFDLEEEISQKVAELREFIEDKNFIKTEEAIYQINSLLKERKARLSM